MARSKSTSGRVSQSTARPAAVRQFGQAQEGSGRAVQIRVLFAQNFAHLENGAGELRIFTRKKRHDLMPQAVPEGKQRRIRGILYMGKRVLFQIRRNLRARNAEHRTDDPAALRGNAAQTAQRRASDEVQKNGFQIVVLCVCRCTTPSSEAKKR